MKFIDQYRKLPLQAKASFWFLICAFFQKAISSITTPIFTRLLTTAEYGSYSVFNSWLSIASIIISLNLWGGVYMQGMVKFEDERKKLSSSFQGLTLTLVLIWGLVYFFLREFWNERFSLNTLQMTAMLCLIWTTSVFNFWASEQRVNFKYRKLVLVTIAVSILKPSLGIFLVLNCDDKVTARIIGLAAVEMVFYMWCFISQMKAGRKFYSKNYWLYGLSFNIPLLPHYLSMSVLSGADRIMISRIIGESQAGIYSLAYSISLIMTMFNNALFQTVEPWLYKKIKAGAIEDISKIAYLSFGVIASINTVLIMFAPEVVRIFAPQEYYDAIWVIPPVTMSVFFMFTYTFFATFEFYYEKRSYIAFASMGGAVLNIILNAVFIRLFGYYAAGYTTLICYVIYALLHYLFMRHICIRNFEKCQPYDWRVLVLIASTFLSVGFAMTITYEHVIVRYGIIIISFVILIIKRRYVKGIINQFVGMEGNK